MRPIREDFAGAEWLLTNRGISKRAVFETREDVERYCAALAVAVERGLLEVQAFTFLVTHYHLLVRSPVGRISDAMQLVGTAFVRWLNRSRRRDGSLFSGPFDGRRIRDEAHWTNVLRYVDLNPVRAKMCRLPSDHPYGSARAYRYEEWPPWLERKRVVEHMRRLWLPGPYQPRHYDHFATNVDGDVNAYLVERLLRHPDRPAPPLADLIRTASLRQQGWMEWKAALADGMDVGTALLPPAAALRAARGAARHLRRELPAGLGTLERDLAAGLLRGASGRTVTEIASDLGLARSTVHAALRRHDRWARISARSAVGSRHCAVHSSSPRG